LLTGGQRNRFLNGFCGGRFHARHMIFDAMHLQNGHACTKFSRATRLTVAPTNREPRNVSVHATTRRIGPPAKIPP
jgi:hypothetical protein